MTGYIKLHRQILEWEWYSDINTKILFLHILLKANFKNMVWRGININRGQLFTSIFHLSSEIGISEKQIRNSLKKLKNTNEIDIQGASNGTMITVCNYETYQSLEISEGEQTASERANEGRAKGERRASEGRQRKNDKKEEKDKLKPREIKDDDPTLFLSPRPSCKHCYGRGFTGYYAENSVKLAGEIKLCSCLSNHLMTGLVSADTKRIPLTYGDFKKMLSYARNIYNLKEDEDVVQSEQPKELSNDSSQEFSKENDNSTDQGRGPSETEGFGSEGSNEYQHS